MAWQLAGSLERGGLMTVRYSSLARRCVCMQPVLKLYVYQGAGQIEERSSVA